MLQNPKFQVPDQRIDGTPKKCFYRTLDYEFDKDTLEIKPLFFYKKK